MIKNIIAWTILVIAGLFFGGALLLVLTIMILDMPPILLYGLIAALVLSGALTWAMIHLGFDKSGAKN